MKNTLLFMFIGFTLLGCKKEEIQHPTSRSFYQSQGNLLLLQVGETFECAYEYNLVSTELNNDSLPINLEVDLTGMFDYNYWIFSPNSDTLISNSSVGVSFPTNTINENDLESLSFSIPFDSTQFQLIGNKYNSEFEPVWEKVSKLEIVKNYRNSQPNSKLELLTFP